MRKMLTAAAMAVGIAALSISPALAERTLRLSLQVSSSHPIGQNIDYFKKMVEDESGGDIKIEVYDSAQLYKGSEIPQAVASGAIDIGLVLIDEFAGTVPVTGIFGVAFMFPNYEVLARAAAPGSEVRTIIDEEIRKTGARVLWWQDYGPVQLLSNGEAIRLPSDLKDKKIRVLGKPSGDFIKAVGGVPVKIGGSEQFLAYQRGTVDIGMTGTTAIETRKLHEVMDHVTITNHAQTEFLMVINDKLWDSLADEERAILGKAAQAAEDKLRSETEANNIASEKVIAEKGMTVVHLTPEELAEWQRAAAPAVDAFIASSGEEGRKLVDAIRVLY
ncbi:MAG: TRAP transporter substrate-binding protein DctP [Caenispirillum sp.]|nr:TRAP transporter substrate-binding protein DctP [Caenispirillum sp.]